LIRKKKDSIGESIWMFFVTACKIRQLPAEGKPSEVSGRKWLVNRRNFE
jgi:hypothetical protein